MTGEEIKKILPHRENMLLLDEVLKEGDVAHGFYRIRGDEWFLKGHFPGMPLVPGVILCEILAQTVCILAETDGKNIPLYTGLKNVRFRSPVRPGDLFETRCRIKSIRQPFYFADGEGYTDGRLCINAEFSFAVMENKFCFQKS